MAKGEMKVQPQPCNQCPFTARSLPGWLGEFNNSKELATIAVTEAPFSCHPANDDQTDLVSYEKIQCAGRLLFASKMAKRFRNTDLEKAREEVLRMNSKDDVLGWKELEQHHSKFEKAGE